MARGYISDLMPSAGNPSTVISRTRIQQSGQLLANSPTKKGKNYDNTNKVSSPKNSGGSNYYEGLDPNCNLARK